MSAETILYIIIAAILSLGVALFMYGYRSKQSITLRWLFGVLRFLSLFALLVLIINPKFKSETYNIVKPKLPVLIDNSASIEELGQTDNALKMLSLLKSNVALNDKFDVSYYRFGSDLEKEDSLSFTERNTNIQKALASVDAVFKNDVAPTILITDGNQTFGNDYEFSTTAVKNPVFPIILGDSTNYIDLRIEQLNTNRYAFLKNQFPVEVVMVYNGDGAESSEFVVHQGTAVVYRQTITFSASDNTKTITFTLPASKTGLQRYNAELLSLKDEKNKQNNSKQFAVEVIDQATNVLVVHTKVHPDLGALHKSISSNEQRSISFMSPSEAIPVLNDYQLLVLYQPDRSFTALYSELKKLRKNSLTITGTQTDWNLLNSIQESFRKDVSVADELVTASLNLNYGTFAVDDLGFDELPPLRTEFGQLEVTVPHEILLEQYVDGIPTGSPLLATIEFNGLREAIWDGEDLWKWRAQVYLQDNSFEAFDDFIGKLVQYIASSKRRSRLEVSSETFYYNNNPIKISAQYFDSNYVFDARALLSINIVNSETEVQRTFPLLLKGNYYEVDLNSLPAGTYNYVVAVQDETVARSGSFTILDFNVEQQFLNANVTKLTRLATNTAGSAFYTSESTKLIDELTNDSRFISVQKSEQKSVPLIDWKYLLGIIILLLSLEWFIRKYNGLI